MTPVISGITGLELKDETVHLFEHLGLFIEENQNDITTLTAQGINPSDLDNLLALEEIEIVSNDGVQVVQWLPSGEKEYKKLIRRHRLAERLVVDILGIPLDKEEKTEGPACQLDHVLADDIADSICTLLGHPSRCPHGHPIPPGQCCARKDDKAPPLWIPLTRGKKGESYSVHTILDEDAAEKLIRLGLSHGSVITVRQTLPTLVVDCEQTTLALDPELAQFVMVRKVGNR